jgi:hypothetical protein
MTEEQLKELALSGVRIHTINSITNELREASALLDAVRLSLRYILLYMDADKSIEDALKEEGLYPFSRQQSGIIDTALRDTSAR